MVAAGGLVAAGLVWLVWVLLPRSASALVRLARYDADMLAHAAAPAPAGATYPGARDRRVKGLGTHRLGALLADWLGRRGVTYPSLRQDLILTGRTFEEDMARKILAAVAGLLLTLTAAGLLRAAGIFLPPAAPAAGALAVGAGLFFAPDLQTRREAAARRADFRRALGSFLDLVALEMAGAAAPAEALPSAARRIGSGWSMALIRDCLYRATKSGQDHWQALTDLGRRIGVPELVELGALIYLVRRDGARVRETLNARAATMRRTRLTDAESHARQRDQLMLVAQILPAGGFMAFLIYAAIRNVILT
jgi:Flp pilus assembly protein TadB